MCGLSGVIGSIFNPEKDMFSQLFMMNVLRGPHGCGLQMLYKEKNKKYQNSLRSIFPSSGYIFTKEYREFLGQTGVYALMGHSRFATKGDRKVENNHPFRTEHLVGMHNGTVAGKFEGSEKYETDSEGIFHLIEAKGLKDALEALYKSTFSPAYVLSYYDNRDLSINFIRNKERPFSYTIDNKGELWYSSEEDMLAFVLERSTTEVFKYETLAPGDLLKVFPFELKHDKRVVLEKEFFKEPLRTVTKYNLSNDVNYGNEYYQAWYAGKEKGEIKKEEFKKRNGNVSFPKKTYVQIGDYIEHFVTKKSFLKILEKGCSFCSQPTTLINDNFDMKFIRSNWELKYALEEEDKKAMEYMCKDCIQFAGECGISESDLLEPRWVE